MYIADSEGVNIWRDDHYRAPILTKC